MSNKCFDGLRCSSLACVGDRCLLKEMTQHTETATPRTEALLVRGGLRPKPLTDLCRELERELADMTADYLRRHKDVGDMLERALAAETKLTTALLELSTERGAVAQYIGERNGLREELKTKEPMRAVTKLVMEENDYLRTQLAQAQNEAYQRGQNDQANHDGPIVNAAYRDGRNKALDEVLQGCARDLTDMMLESCNLMDVGLQDAAWAHRIRADQECVRYNIVLALKSPNSAEGEKPAFKTVDEYIQNDATAKLLQDASPTWTWTRVNTKDELESFYQSILPAIREAAHKCGFAIAVHGSMRRDLDLIASPWVDSHCDVDALARAVQKAACGMDQERYQWEQKPCGRIATSFPVCWTKENVVNNGHIDLSIPFISPSKSAEGEPG